MSFAVRHRRRCGLAEDAGPDVVGQLGDVLVEVVAQHLRAGGVAQPGDGLALNPPGAFSGNSVYLADLVVGQRFVVQQPNSQANDGGLELANRVEDLDQLGEAELGVRPPSDAVAV